MVEVSFLRDIKEPGTNRKMGFFSKNILTEIKRHKRIEGEYI
jgi:hypothetical protein